MHDQMGETQLEKVPISRPLLKANFDALIGSSNPMGSGWWTSDRMLMEPPVGETSLACTIQQSTTATGTNLSYVRNRERSLCIGQPRNPLNVVVTHSGGSAAVGVLCEEVDVLSADEYTSAELALMRLRYQVGHCTVCRINAVKVLILITFIQALCRSNKKLFTLNQNWADTVVSNQN